MALLHCTAEWDCVSTHTHTHMQLHTQAHVCELHRIHTVCGGRILTRTVVLA